MPIADLCNLSQGKKIKMLIPYTTKLTDCSEKVGKRGSLHARRYLFGLLRYAVISAICGSFFMIGVQVCRRWDRNCSGASSDSKNSGHLDGAFVQNESRNNYNNQIGPADPPNKPPWELQPGEMGKPVPQFKITHEQDLLVKQGWQNNAFNQFVSDLISVNRSLPDMRSPMCQDNQYLPNPPKVSVIIVYHNEAWSTLLRSVYSVINRSPPELIKEIILVDDNSTMPHLMDQLDSYMSRLKQVRIIRAPERLGLINARILGADNARGKILVFLDSHIEATEGWLAPLLDRIVRNFTTVVMPMINTINDATFEFIYDQGPPESIYRPISTFEWSLHQAWEPISEREKKKHNSTSEPYASPTMAGGLFAINKRYFEYLGKYDPGFDIWGGENLELSFKTWMCGGRLEQVPCSHVGHIFRTTSPYKGRDGQLPHVQSNLVRLAKVWMDEYAKYFYIRSGMTDESKMGNYGDISDRIALRKRLKCKSFKWFLENVYPEVFIPDNGYAYGEIRNVALGNNTCLDASMDPTSVSRPVIVYPCHRQGGNQEFSYSRYKEIRRDANCLDYSGGESVMVLGCHGTRGNQEWIYDAHTMQMKHSVSQKCVAITSTNNLAMDACNSSVEGQKWQLENYKEKLKSDPFEISI